MTFALRVKRAMYDNLPSYNDGRSVDHNWDDRDSTYFYSFCNKFGGTFTQFPSREGQSEDFLNLVDKYEDSDYTNEKVQEPTPVKHGTDLRQFIPDRQPIPEGTVEEKRLRNAIVNENVNVKSPSHPSKPDEETGKDNASKSSEPQNDSGDANKSDDMGNKDPSSTNEGTKTGAEQNNKEPEKSKAPESVKPKSGNNVQGNKIRVR